MRGEYKVKHPGLQPLHARARLLVAELDRVVFEHVRREFNTHADRLSNLGMDEAERALKQT
jgi:probable phosphoglycerate mutase